MNPQHKQQKSLALQPPILLTVVLLAFGAGILAARLWFAPVAMPQSAVAPTTPTPVPPTSVPPVTPTPTSPDIGDVLQTLYIDIAPDDFAKIQAKRDEALAQWILQASDADLVPATVRLGQDDAIPVRLRLKGDWADHFAHAKWSYRIQMRGDNYLLGMRVFSMQDPSTRAYLNEWLFLENLRAEDVLAVSYRFVHGVQNGASMGIYALEEGFSKELLESQSRREGVIIRYNEDLLWEYWADFEHDQVTPRGVSEFYIIDEFQSGKVQDDPVLSAQRDVAVGKLRAWWAGELDFSEVFDVASMAKFLALTDVWDAQHAVQWHNLRFYYNPVTTVLEPVAFDTQPLEGSTDVVVSKLKGLQLVRDYDDVGLQQTYFQALWRYSQPEYLETMRAHYEAEFEALRAALEPEFGAQVTAEGQSVLAPPWDALAQRQSALREWLSPIQMTYAYVPSEAPTDTLFLDLGNFLSLPVEILGVQVGETWLAANRNWVVSPAVEPVLPAFEAGDALVLRALAQDAEFMDYVRVQVPPQDWATLSVSQTQTLPPLHLETRLWGMTQTVTQPVLPAYPPLTDGPLPVAPSLDVALRQHPYLERVPDVEQMLTIPAGMWAVSESLVLPEGYGLRLEAGTTLSFGAESYLLARGPLVFEGTQTAPIMLLPRNERWLGIVVLDVHAPSYWTHVSIQDTDAIDLPGWSLTGGITFYQSPIHLSHSRILGTQAEDGINVIRARFAFVDSEFAGTASDAFDADFCQGTIERSIFHDIGADGIDVSGSEVVVRDVRMFALGDKALSVGEASRLTAERVSITDVDFGVVSKDLSQVALQDVSIDNARIAGLAAYIKKPSYGPASITAQAIAFINIPEEQQTLVQTGSWVDLDGVRIWGVDVDIDALYEKWKR